MNVDTQRVMLTWSPHATCKVEMEKEESLQKEDL